ncbi:hypothetical protein OAK90_01830 [bacterium]|nr:hypothetical protein [bacterium]
MNVETFLSTPASASALLAGDQKKEKKGCNYFAGMFFLTVGVLEA